MRRILSLFETAKDTTTTLLWLFGAVSMLGAIGLAFEKWFSHLSTFGIVSFYVMAGGLFLVICTLVLNWMQKRDIERIPDLIEKLDVLTTNFIDDFRFDLTEDKWKKVNADYSSILGIDLCGLEEVCRNPATPQKKLDLAYDGVCRAYLKNLDPQRQQEESLEYLGDMGSILDSYNCGLSVLKATPQYQKLEKKIKALQRKAPSAYISVQVNNYFIISERLYILLMGTKPLFEQQTWNDRLPVKVKAKKSQVRPIVEGQIANLISGVRESITKYKERNMAQKETDKQGEKPVNRAERRHGGKY